MRSSLERAQCRRLELEQLRERQQQEWFVEEQERQCQQLMSSPAGAPAAGAGSLRRSGVRHSIRQRDPRFSTWAEEAAELRHKHGKALARACAIAAHEAEARGGGRRGASQGAGAPPRLTRRGPTRLLPLRPPSRRSPARGAPRIPPPGASPGGHIRRSGADQLRLPRCCCTPRSSRSPWGSTRWRTLSMRCRSTARSWTRSLRRAGHHGCTSSTSRLRNRTKRGNGWWRARSPSSCWRTRRRFA